MKLDLMRQADVSLISDMRMDFTQCNFLCQATYHPDFQAPYVRLHEYYVSQHHIYGIISMACVLIACWAIIFSNRRPRS